MRRALMLIFGVQIAIAAQAQSIDSGLSNVKFGIDNMKVRTVPGTFSGMKGEINFDEANLEAANFKVCIDASSIDTENSKRDKHLRTADFFDTDKYPEICFTSASITKANVGYATMGKLQMHGVTKQETINFTYSAGKFIGNLNVNRYDYKIGEDTGTFMVGEDVEIEINAVVN